VHRFFFLFFQMSELYLKNKALTSALELLVRSAKGLHSSDTRPARFLQIVARLNAGLPCSLLTPRGSRSYRADAGRFVLVPLAHSTLAWHGRTVLVPVKRPLPHLRFAELSAQTTRLESHTSSLPRIGRIKPTASPSGRSC
jgi:hypothetical protein